MLTHVFYMALQEVFDHGLTMVLMCRFIVKMFG